MVRVPSWTEAFRIRFDHGPVSVRRLIIRSLIQVFSCRNGAAGKLVHVEAMFMLSALGGVDLVVLARNGDGCVSQTTIGDAIEVLREIVYIDSFSFSTNLLLLAWPLFGTQAGMLVD